MIDGVPNEATGQLPSQLERASAIIKTEMAIRVIRWAGFTRPCIAWPL